MSRLAFMKVARLLVDYAGVNLSVETVFNDLCFRIIHLPPLHPRPQAMASWEVLQDSGTDATATRDAQSPGSQTLRINELPAEVHMITTRLQLHADARRLDLQEMARVGGQREQQLQTAVK